MLELLGIARNVIESLESYQIMMIVLGSSLIGVYLLAAIRSALS